MWKLYSRTDGTHNLVIQNEQGANDADPRVGNQLEIDAGMLFWPNIPDMGPVMDFAPMIEFTSTYNDMAQWSSQPFIYHAPTVTFTGSMAPTQAGLIFEGTYDQDGNSVLMDASGIKLARVNTVTDYNTDLLMGPKFEVYDVYNWDNSDSTAGNVLNAYADYTNFKVWNDAVVVLNGDVDSFISGPTAGSDGSGSFTINKFVGFHAKRFGSGSGSPQTHILEHVAFQIDNDTNSDVTFGIYSDLNTTGRSPNTANLFINHVGDAPSFFGAAIEATAFNLTAAETYTTSNVTPDRSFDADEGDITVVSDVLATLIEDLKTAGILT
jgi:hypothetical protein